MTQTAKTTRRPIFVVLSIATLFGFGCGGTEFHVNPPLAPSPVSSPNPTPTAQILRSIPYSQPTRTVRAVPNDRTPESGVAPVIIQFRAKPTPLPQFKFIVTPTPGPPVVLANGQVYPPGSRVLSGAPVLADLPESNLREAFERIQWQEAASVKSKFYWPAVEESAADENDMMLVQAEGEYKLTVIEDDDASDSAFLLNNASDFHLHFLQELPGVADPTESEIEAQGTRLVTDTLGTGLKIYPSLAAWQDDVDREMSGMMMFISLALTGGRLVGDDVAELFTFQRGEVTETTRTGLYNRRDSMFEANRVNDNGDGEEWRIWLDFYERPERIELSVTSENPERSVIRAELEITYSVDVLEPAG